MLARALSFLLSLGAANTATASSSTERTPPIGKAVVKIVSKAPPRLRDLVSSGLRVRFRKIDPGHPPVAFFVFTTAHGLHLSPLAGPLLVFDEGSRTPTPCRLINADFRTDVAILECPPPGDPAGAFDLHGEGYESLRFLAPPPGRHETSLGGWLLGFPAKTSELHAELKEAKNRNVVIVNDPAARIHPGLKDHLEVSGVRADPGLSGGVFVSTGRYWFTSMTNDPAELELFPGKDGGTAIPLGLVSKRLSEDRVGLIPMRTVLAVFLRSVRFGAWPKASPSTPFAGGDVRQDPELHDAHPLNVTAGDLTFLMEREDFAGNVRRTIRVEPSGTFDFDRIDRDVLPYPGSFYRRGSYYFNSDYLFGQRTILLATRRRPNCTYMLVASFDENQNHFRDIERYESVLEPFLTRRGSIFGWEFKFPGMLMRIACGDDEKILAKIAALSGRYTELRRTAVPTFDCDIFRAESFMAAVRAFLARGLTELPPPALFADWQRERERHAWRCQTRPPSDDVADDVDREIRKIFLLVEER